MDSPDDEPPSERIGPYRILRMLGRGALGTVYLAEHIHLNRQVALKVLYPGIGTQPSVLDRLRREAQITYRLAHPGICTVYEAGEDRGVLWIAMRYVEGQPLSRKIWTAKECLESGASPQVPMTWTAISYVLAMFAEAARALHLAHEAGVIHGDIKPGNMMVTKDGHPVVVDFGLAQVTSSDLPTLTITGDLMGMPAYMSPEQLVGHGPPLDRRTDVYSLAVSLFECLTLRRPFEALTRDVLGRAVMTQEADLLRPNPAIPSDLRVVVATALEKDRNRRYQTALDFAEDLERVLSREPIRAAPLGLGARFWRRVVRKFRPRSGIPPLAPPVGAGRGRDEGEPGRPPITLGAAAPTSVRPGEEFSARFFACLRELQDEVRTTVKQRSPRSQPLMDLHRCSWEPGTSVQVTFQATHLTVEEPGKEFIWSGSSNIIEFDAVVSPDAPDCVVVLKFNVYVEALRVAQLRMDMVIDRRSRSRRDRYVKGEPVSSAFASYASQDRDRVLDRVASVRTSTGIDIFLDCFSLHPSDEWRVRLKEEIMDRDLFMLFWSRHASSSPWVQWEWKSALESKRSDTIQIHALDTVEEAPPPAELSHLHFGDPLMRLRK